MLFVLHISDKGTTWPFAFTFLLKKKQIDYEYELQHQRIGDGK